MEALEKRHSSREFAPDALPLPLLSNLLWAAYGVNRVDGGRTAPSALNAQEIDVYVALPDGAYLYDHEAHALNRVVESDLRRVTGYQDFVDEAPLDLVYVADHARMAMVPVAYRESYASVAAGAIAQNVYLFSASTGLSTVIRAGSTAPQLPTRWGCPMINKYCCHRRWDTPRTTLKFKAQQRNRYFTVSNLKP